jgi:DNA-binding transcriptional ArsR family regulator
VSHGASPDPGELLDPRAAGQVAETMQALATPSRLRILACLHEEPRSVSEISAAVGMDGSAVSHQLRILRHLGLVTGERDGRRVNYSLYDHHVAQLLEQAMSHVEHLRLGLVDGARRGAAASAR